MAPLRVGLIGTGHWAGQVHAPGIAASRVATLSGVWGRDPHKADQLARQFSTRCYTDVDALFADVDAVSMAVPPDLQSGLAVRAAQAGCHLLLEKPLALDVVSAELVVSTVQEAGVAAIIFFTSRYVPSVERWMDEARAAPWQSAHFVQYANIYQPGSPYHTSGWRHRHGALWDIGPHALAAIVPIMGPVISVAGRRGGAGSDTVHLVLSHGSGRPEEEAPDFVARNQPGGMATTTVSVSLTFPPAGAARRLDLYGEGGHSKRPEGEIIEIDAFRRAISEVAGLVRSGERQHRCDVNFGLQIVKVLAAAERSLELPGSDVIGLFRQP
jgi:predicted dehydrogenase